jgi:PKD repeat protein
MSMLMRVTAVLVILAAACGGGDDPPSDPDAGTDDDAMMPAGTASIAGQVISETATGSSAVAGAVVSIPGGPSTTTDATGGFRFDGLSPDEDVSIEVRGPRADDPTHPFVYTTARQDVPVSSDATTAVAVALVQGCERFFDASAGGTVTLVSCGAGGEADLTFPPNALVYDDDDTPFTGQARAELAVLHPDAGAQAMAFPSLSPEPWAASMFGGVEVRLRDALTGEALQVANGSTVDVAIEVHDDTVGAIDDVLLRWFDPSERAWVDEPTGVLEDRNGRAFYRFSAAHFSQRAVAIIGSPDMSCLDVTITGTNRVVALQMRSGPRYWYAPRSAGGPTLGGCIPVPAGIYVDIRATPGPGIGSAPPPLSPWVSGVLTPAALPSPLCANTCLPLTIDVQPAGCIDGTYASSNCPASGTRLGVVYFMRDGNIFHRETGDVCSHPFSSIEVPNGNGPVILGDSTGASFTSSAPLTPGGMCSTLGAVSATGAAFRASFTAASVRVPPAGPGTEYYLNLDASPSQGQIHTYQWVVSEVVDGDATVVWSESSPTPTTTVDVDAGRFEISLGIYSGIELFAEHSELMDVPGPTASFTASTTTPAPNDTIMLDASASTGTIVSYEWDFDGDMVFDATGATTSHSYAAQGPQQIRLRVTDGDGAIDEHVVDISVQSALPPNTLQVTIVGNGYVISAFPTGFMCVGPGVCQQAYAPNASVLLEAYNPDDSPNHTAWGNHPNADGHQVGFTFTGQSESITANF